MNLTLPINKKQINNNQAVYIPHQLWALRLLANQDILFRTVKVRSILKRRVPVYGFDSVEKKILQQLAESESYSFERNSPLEKFKQLTSLTPHPILSLQIFVLNIEDKRFKQPPGMMMPCLGCHFSRSVMRIQSLMSIMDLDSIQNNLFESITLYLANISLVEEHMTLLKAVVLVLKIIEYDLSKNEGPITIGYGFFSMVVLSDEQRRANHTKIKELQTEIIEKFDLYNVQERVCSTSLGIF